MRISSKGQVTIPVEIHEQAGLMPNTEVDFEFDGTAVRIIPSAARSMDSRGRVWQRICEAAAMPP
jgi:AbrB family looped-hinge helix DNA binding protein